MALCKAEVLRELGEDEEALAAYDAALALDPTSAEAHNGKGFVLEALQQPLRALVAYDQANFCDPQYAPAWHNKANLLRQLERYDEAERARKRADQLGYNW